MPRGFCSTPLSGRFLIASTSASVVAGVQDTVGARVCLINPWARRSLSMNSVFNVMASKPVRNVLTRITRPI